MSPLVPIYGAIVGLSLGLTGGGGAIFAVPLLIYGLGVPPRSAVGISLLTVGATSLVGFAQRARSRQVEFRTGLLFAAAGMAGAPVGLWLARRTSDAVLLGMFTMLMLVIAFRMWTNATADSESEPILSSDAVGPACRRDSRDALRITSDCAALLAAIGLAVGVLTGLFGVGGGFIIVPALVMFTRMGMQEAIGTSLLVITMTSSSGLAGHWAADKDMPIAVAGVFSLGSVAGLFAGSWISRRVSAPMLHRIFAAAILGVAIYVVARTHWSS